MRLDFIATNIFLKLTNTVAIAGRKFATILNKFDYEVDFSCPKTHTVEVNKVFRRLNV